MNIYIDRSFIASQSDLDLLYLPLTESPTSLNMSQAYLTKGPTPIIIDSSTTSHIHNKQLDFESLSKDNTNNITGFGDGSVSSSGHSTAIVWTKSPGCEGAVNCISLSKAMLVPSSNISLLSVSRFDKAGCQIESLNGQCTISDAKTNELILTGTIRKKLYYLDNITPNAPLDVPMKIYHMTNSKITLDLMHQCFAIFTQ